MELFNKWSYKNFIKNRVEIYHMKELWKNDEKSQFYPEARYAIEVFLQQGNRPAGNICKKSSAENIISMELNRTCLLHQMELLLAVAVRVQNPFLTLQFYRSI